MNILSVALGVVLGGFIVIGGLFYVISKSSDSTLVCEAQASEQTFNRLVVECGLRRL